MPQASSRTRTKAMWWAITIISIVTTEYRYCDAFQAAPPFLRSNSVQLNFWNKNFGFGGDDKDKPSTSLSPESTVLVVGGTGGVGQLVTKKLVADDYKVRVATRDVERGKEVMGEDNVEFAELDLVKGDDSLFAAAMQGVSAVVIATGTTAFPTKKWIGGNTPSAIDDIAVTKLAEAAAAAGSVKKLVLITSVGVDRTDEVPFSILNLFGVLDAKRNGENAVVSAATQSGFEYAIVRPGRLVGGPYTNLDLAKLLQIEGGAENGVTVEVGDALLGDCKRDACAEAVVQCLRNTACKNVAFSLVSNEEKALTTEQWTTEFQKMSEKETA